MISFLIDAAAAFDCEKCGCKMQNLAMLRSIGVHAATTVFKCSPCGRVVSIRIADTKAMSAKAQKAPGAETPRAC